MRQSGLGNRCAEKLSQGNFISRTDLLQGAQANSLNPRFPFQTLVVFERNTESNSRLLLGKPGNAAVSPQSFGQKFRSCAQGEK